MLNLTSFVLYVNSTTGCLGNIYVLRLIWDLLIKKNGGDRQKPTLTLPDNFHHAHLPQNFLSVPSRTWTITEVNAIRLFLDRHYRPIVAEFKTLLQRQTTHHRRPASLMCPFSPIYAPVLRSVYPFVPSKFLKDRAIYELGRFSKKSELQNLQEISYTAITERTLLKSLFYIM